MIERRFVRAPGGAEVLLTDSVSFIRPEDRGRIVVCASHGGRSSGQYAADRAPGLIIFNDAGVGKDDAGIAALGILGEAGIAACAVSSGSARIGDVLDHWDHGVIAHANEAAAVIEPGLPVRDAVQRWATR